MVGLRIDANSDLALFIKWARAKADSLDPINVAMNQAQ